MRFKIDENLPGEIAAMLRAAGHDAFTVAQQNMGGHRDPNVAHVCQMEHRILVTLDWHFADITNYPPHQHAGIVILSPHSQGKKRIIRLFETVMPYLESEPVEGCLWIAEETRLRIRHG